MQNIYDLVDLGQLNGLVRGLLFPDLTLSRWLPNVGVDRTHYRYALNDRSQRAAARFISFDSEAPIAGRPGLSVKMGELPPIKEKSVLTESDQILQESLADVLPEAMQATVFSDAALRARAILQRIELAKGEALSKGKVTINEGGLKLLPVSFGVPAGQMDVAPLGALWSDHAASVPITDLTTWRDAAIAAGVNIGTIITSTATMTHLQLNAQIIGAVAGTTSGRTRVTRTEINDLLISEGLPPIEVYDAQYKNPSGTLTRAIDANRVVFLPPDGTGFGQTQFGRTREAVELAGNGVDLGEFGGIPGLAAVTMKSFDPVEIWTKVAAIALPVIETPDQIFSAVVTA